ncbi:MAG TPA: FeoA family protein [Chthoniobacterales bacterium]|nr:FeoA family protein [Chthoniobacterales bacterium]
MRLPLSQLQLGECGIVRQLPEKQVLASRLREMGLLKGTEVTLMRRAPMGDPLEIRLRGYSLSLRNVDAAEVLVDVVRGNSNSKSVHLRISSGYASP